MAERHRHDLIQCRRDSSTPAVARQWWLNICHWSESGLDFQKNLRKNLGKT